MSPERHTPSYPPNIRVRELSQSVKLDEANHTHLQSAISVSTTARALLAATPTFAPPLTTLTFFILPSHSPHFDSSDRNSAFSSVLSVSSWCRPLSGAMARMTSSFRCAGKSGLWAARHCRLANVGLGARRCVGKVVESSEEMRRERREMACRTLNCYETDELEVYRASVRTLRLPLGGEFILISMLRLSLPFSATPGVANLIPLRSENPSGVRQR